MTYADNGQMNARAACHGLLTTSARAAVPSRAAATTG